ncbi:MAG: tRNA 2-thiouridine(34) synthase MnmA [Oscillospiraceae bacterium]|nr:tRNA 2-thiouridine(34) synthase MnmA [Oscillospiraceae bacterium]
MLGHEKRVAVGMSGGVDSSVAALILKEQGFEVVGLTLALCGNGPPPGVGDAKKVAEHIGIEHHVLDLRGIFRKKVTDYFVREYQNGATPNPCAVCNREIKFGAMLDAAGKLSAGRLATGHYAAVEFNEKSGRYMLRKSPCGKDQSYFLALLRQDQLKAAMFPLAGMSKDAVREIAVLGGLPVAHKPDSQEICFIPDNNYVQFIREYTGVPPKEGDFVDAGGHVIGRHMGIVCYTVGQRKGLGAFGRPMFVTGINAAENTVILGEGTEQNAGGFIAEDMNWIAFDRPPSEFTAEVKIRFRARPAKAVVYAHEDGMVEVRFDEPQRAVTPGQIAALYDGENLLGGGRIREGIRL